MVQNIRQRPTKGADWFDYDGDRDAAIRELQALAVGAMIPVRRVSGAWPARPTTRTDVTVIWIGADPSPNIVSSGTGGMLDGIDLRFTTP